MALGKDLNKIKPKSLRLQRSTKIKSDLTVHISMKLKTFTPVLFMAKGAWSIVPGFPNTMGPFRYSWNLKTENWKHCSKIIFKCMNNTVWPSFNLIYAFFCTCRSCKQYTESIEKSQTLSFLVFYVIQTQPRLDSVTGFCLDKLAWQVSTFIL